MNVCTACGHALGLGRFCTNCGQPAAALDPLSDPISNPIDDPLGEPILEPPHEPPGESSERPEHRDVEEDVESTAERAAVATPSPAAPFAASTAAVAAPSDSTTPSVRIPPTAAEPPPPPRYPLYADEVAAAVPVEEWASSDPPLPTHTEVTQAPETHLDPPSDLEIEPWEGSSTSSRAPWLAGVLTVIALLVGAAWYLGQSLADGDDDTREEPASSGLTSQTAGATATAPRSAPDNVDVDGSPTTYDAANMLDGLPETAWRAAGDGKGIKIVITFDSRVDIREVGLINGYAKESTDGEGQVFDWYAGHRRITAVTWTFGTGNVVRQELQDTSDLQTIEVEPVSVRKLVLKIVGTTEPGSGVAGRNFTAISEVRLAG